MWIVYSLPSLPKLVNIEQTDLVINTMESARKGKRCIDDERDQLSEEDYLEFLTFNLKCPRFH